MKKKTPSMMIGYLMIALVVVAYMAMQPKRNNPPPSTFNQVMELLNNGDYPADPYTLIDVNNKFLMCIYGGAILDEEIEPVIIKQRQLFADELLELNPLETHVATTQEQIDLYREKQLYVHTTNIENIQYDKTDKNICYVTITQHNTGLASLSTQFYLVYRNNEWKILGWDTIREVENE